MLDSKARLDSPEPSLPSRDKYCDVLLGQNMPESRRYQNPGQGSAQARSQSRPRPRPHRKSSSCDDGDHDRDKSRRRRSRRHSEYSGDSSKYASPPPPRRARARATPEGGPRRRHHSRSASHDGGFNEQISREKREQAIKSAVTAGAVEAFRQRNRPGPWLGEKGVRVATAAVSAAAIDSAVDKNPRRKGTRNVLGSTLGGLVIDKVASALRQR